MSTGASWYDTLMSHTVGAAVRAATGNVDQWTLQAQKDNLAVGIAQAKGPNADPADVTVAQNAAQAEQVNYLKSINTHPDQPGIRIPGHAVLVTPEFLPTL